MRTASMTIAALLLAASSAPAFAVHDRQDFQSYEDTHHLADADTATVTPEALKTYSQVQLDYLYARLKSGPLPEGSFVGTVIFDNSADNDIEKALHSALPDDTLEQALKTLGVNLWRGKVFDRPSQTAINRIDLIERFPGKVYCGQSLIDSRRESIVLDYRYSQDLPAYNSTLDWLVTSKGLAVRDEMRMIRPGLYLGRAYIYGLFALNFVLAKDPSALTPADSEQTCFAGIYTQE